MRWLVFAGLGCSSPPDSGAPEPRPTPVVAKSSKAKPSAGRRGPDALRVVPYGTKVDVPCANCDACVVREVEASSVRPASAGERFDAANLVDGNPSSAWCDAPSGDEPSSVTFTVPSGCRVVGARILSGHLANPKHLSTNGRAAEIILTAGRLRGAAELDDPVGLPLNFKQIIDAPLTLFTAWDAHPVDTLTVTFPVAHRGSVHEGVCLSAFDLILAGAPTED